MCSPSIQKLIDLFSRFPGVGPRTASRFVFYLLQKSPAEFNEFLLTLNNLKKSVKLCVFCQNPFEPPSGRLPYGSEPKPGSQQVLCEICSDPRRDKTLLCVVEKEADLEALEKTKKYPGLYFILGTLLTPLQKKEKEKQVVENLLKRIKNPTKFGLIGAEFEEIILALSFTTEGQATVLYLERVLKPFNKKISRLGLGMPTGGELEYADEETISAALEGRR